jgi:DNA-binding beta-propeller fold protein YncE
LRPDFIDSSDPYVTTPTVLHTFPGTKTIAGVTVLGKELYVLRDQVSNVEVYDTVEPWTGLRRLTIPGLRWPSDIAACPANNKIYIADMFGYVYIFEPAGTTFSKFQVIKEIDSKLSFEY